MIFVTVGTHEQQFNRLVEFIDRYKGEGKTGEEIIIQTGFSTYEPKHCQWSKLYTYEEMQKYTQEARIVITHGGPSSFIAPLQLGKIPIVVPRQKRFGEHVNDHQVHFCKEVANRNGNIILVEDVDTLGAIIEKYDATIESMPTELKGNNQKFCEGLEKLIEAL